MEVFERRTIGEQLKLEEFSAQRDAYKRFCERDSDGNQAVKVFAAIVSRGSDGATMQEIEDITGIKIASICGRLDDLIHKSVNPRIFEANKRWNEGTRSWNTVYKAISQNNELFDQVKKTMGWN